MEGNHEQGARRVPRREYGAGRPRPGRRQRGRGEPVMRVLMIDNYDSFTYNLVQYLQELGAEVLVHRNDKIDLAGMEALNADRLMISPGPCTPNEAGISVDAIKHFAGKIPVLGVCLGHQALGQAFGGQVVRARTVMHGKTSPVHHTGKGVFRGLPSPYTATRYHSLVVDKASLPDCFEVTAWTLDDNGDMDEIMGMRHRELPLEGVQYHPESILTEHGHDLLNNFLKGESA
ncbi:MAG TPA: anthranilate/aminodeoxychorismate synthase component II [Alcanivorax sp.]|nr:anthranilate/aminodeoxychorismate synthase component II [Alcanivorax sp.]